MEVHRKCGSRKPFNERTPVYTKIHPNNTIPTSLVDLLSTEYTYPYASGGTEALKIYHTWTSVESKSK